MPVQNSKDFLAPPAVELPVIADTCAHSCVNITTRSYIGQVSDSELEKRQLSSSSELQRVPNRPEGPFQTSPAALAHSLGIRAQTATFLIRRARFLMIDASITDRARAVNAGSASPPAAAAGHGSWRWLYFGYLGTCILLISL